MNKDDLEEILSQEFLSEDARAAFLAMPREEQLLAILSMQAYLRSKVAVVEKRQIDFERKTDSYRNHREKKEADSEESITSISQRIAEEIQKALAQRFDFWVWVRDKVMPQITSVAILILLYLIFQHWTP